jgi:hypothetical protein
MVIRKMVWQTIMIMAKSICFSSFSSDPTVVLVTNGSRNTESSCWYTVIVFSGWWLFITIKDHRGWYTNTRIVNEKPLVKHEVDFRHMDLNVFIIGKNNDIVFLDQMTLSRCNVVKYPRIDMHVAVFPILLIWALFHWWQNSANGLSMLSLSLIRCSMSVVAL